MKYQYTDGSEKTYQSPSTLMDEILQTLATIAALDCTGPQHDLYLKPKLFFLLVHIKISYQSLQLMTHSRGLISNFRKRLDKLLSSIKA